MPAEPLVLTQHGALVIAESGPQVLVLDLGTAPPVTKVRVLALLALAFGGYGLVSIFSGSAGSRSWQSFAVGVVLVGAGIAAFVAMKSASKTLRRIEMTPLSSYPPVAVLDRAQRVYRDGTGELVATLDEVRFERRREFPGSSLVAVTPSGTRALKVFRRSGIDLSRIVAVLNDAVHRTP